MRDIFTIPAFLRGYGQKYQAKELSTEVMVSELHRRGVTIERIFGQYYAIEEAAVGLDWQHNGTGEEGQHGKPLTVGDALLAGEREPTNTQEIPF